MMMLLRKLAMWFARSRSDEGPFELCGLDASRFSKGAITWERENQIASQITAMPLMVREVYLLSMIDRMPVAEIAHRLAISETKVMRYLQRAIASLTAHEDD